MAKRVIYGKGGKVRSINSMTTDYKRFVDVVEADTRRIMEGAAQITLNHILPLVPVETGALKESGTARAVKTKKGVAAVVTFGGKENPVSPTKNAPAGIVDYANYVNYDTSLEHIVGESLFLEKGTASAKQEVDAYIIREYRKVQPK